MSSDADGPRVIPNHIHNPVGLALRVLKAGGSHGRFSVLAAGLAVAARPLDLALRRWEQQLRATAGAPNRPVALVCGPARSGTTIMAQAFAKATSAAYVTNLMDIFPRSPLAASRVFRLPPRAESVPLTSHYGWAAGFSSPNDALNLWDRWLGSDRKRPEGSRAKIEAADINGFFGALEGWTDRFVSTKNNALNAVASEVGEALPAARFICMQRDDLHLAQSLLIARRYIYGDETRAYGLHSPAGRSDDFVEDVANQVGYHRELAARESERLGPERFRIVEYERLCRQPRAVITELAKALDVDVDVTSIPDEFPVSERVSVDTKTFNRLKERLSG